MIIFFYLLSFHSVSYIYLYLQTAASFAVKFLKARQAKLAKKKLQEETEIRFENNNILPSTIPVEVYLESLQTLRSQKEHRRVDLLKEQRWKKAVKRRDVSMQVRI